MIAMVRACALGLVLLLSTACMSWAADQTITLELGVGSVLVLERPFETVLIGDPEVVDVHTQTDRSVMLEPLQPGASNVIFVDERNIAITNIRILVCNVVRTKYREGSDCE